MLEGSPDAEILVLEKARNRRVGAATLIRRFKKKSYPTPEYTGFVDFDNFIFMCVLFTPEPLEKKNLRKLRSVIGDVFPMNVTHNHTAQIAAAQARLRESIAASERASLLSQIGRWYWDMGRQEDARRALEESLSIVPGNYDAINLLLATLTKLGDKEATLNLMSRLLRLDPHNPTVFDDCILYSRGSPYSGGSAVESSDLLHLLEGLKADYPDDPLVGANCDFYACKILMPEDLASARKHLQLAMGAFRRLFPRGHQVFRAIRSALRQLSQTTRRIPPSGA